LAQSSAVSPFLQVSFGPTILIEPELLVTHEWILVGSSPCANAAGASSAAKAKAAKQSVRHKGPRITALVPAAISPFRPMLRQMPPR
jgi:hypothetical protein